MHIHAKPLVVLASGLLLSTISSATFARSIVCESQDRMTQHCPADTRNGVSLSTQYSRASCRQGSTWGYDNRGIWVSNGCRAQFDIGDYRSGHGSDRDSKAAAALAIGLIGAAAIAAHHDHDNDRDRDRYDYRPGDYHSGFGPSQRITCESQDNRQHYCYVNLRHASVDLDQQLSRTQCRYGDNWGWDNSGIWVQDGCRAVFSVY
ncbi:MAG: hypothetical protein BWZ07_00526 [Alphaproteobacteria bacterium ADurb.BinA280]|jgi:hypothetical protein|nr:DUF3011 domain-containing protein [Xanthomonadales bacterium]MCC6504405.1 DUF3011 domain-containing protein [Aquimonas sp.]OPZ13466.1 MAG: hypothetical protein BWZ07_00526 [Alphaproteobacteria bacterium ADurb.BinA280]